MNGPILLPLDGSPLAEIAIPHAISQARKDGAPLLLIRAIKFPLMPLMAEPNMISGEEYQRELDAERDEARRYIESMATEMRATGLEVSDRCILGDAVSIILSAASESEASMIVLATHGRSGLTRWFYGSVAEGVLRGATVPVLLIPAGHRPGA